MAKPRKTVMHDFYCLKCGRKGLPVHRRIGHQHAKFHRKKLYCFYCQEEINHMECRTQAEIDEFKAAFERGDFVDEAEESICFIQSGRMR